MLVTGVTVLNLSRHRPLRSTFLGRWINRSTTQPEERHVSVPIIVIVIVALLGVFVVRRMRQARRTFDTIMTQEAAVTRGQHESGGRHRLSA